MAPPPCRPGKSPKNRVYYRCDKCSYQTEIQSLLDRHIAKHAMDCPFQCSLCDFSDYDHSSFVDHWITHQQTKVIRCPFCSFKCGHPNWLKTHIPKHRPVEMLDCSMCEFSSNYVQSMKNHIEAFHAKLYPCEHCKELMTKHDLIEHCEKVQGAEPVQNSADRPKPDLQVKRNDEHHKAEPSRGMPEDSLEIKPVVEREVSKSGCGASGHSYCNCTPAEPDELMGLPKAESDLDLKPEMDELKCSLCEFTATNHLSLRYHGVVFHKKKVSCDHCSAVMTKHDMIQHALNEHGVEVNARPVVKNDAVSTDSEESECSGVEEPISSPVRDMTDFSSTAKGFKCAHCGYSAKSRCSLDSHVLRLHTKKRSCGYCSAVLTKHELTEHYRNAHKASKHELTEHCQNAHGVTVKASYRHFREAELCIKDKKGVRNSGGSGASSNKDDQLLGRNTADARKFTCAVCHFSSLSKYGLKKHEERFHKKKYSCKHCKVVMTKYCLMLHSKKEHGVVMKLTGAASLREALKQRMGLSRKYVELQKPASPLLASSHVRRRRSPADQKLSDATSGKTFSCLICPYSSFLAINLKKHVLIHHKKQYTCKRCSAVMSRHELIKHSKNVHGVNIRRVGIRSQGEIVDNLDGSKELVRDNNVTESNAVCRTDKNREMSSLKCLSFTSESSKMAANPKFQKSQNGPCASASLAAPEPTLNSESHSELLQCHSCSYKTKIKSLMSRHVLLHLPEGQFACPKCDFRENRTAAFAAHLKSHNKSNASFKCCFCSFSTTVSQTFKDHINTHRAVGSYYCTKCHFSCSFRSSLRRHVHSHHEGKVTAGTKLPGQRHPSSEFRPLRLKSKASRKQGRLGSYSVRSNIKCRMAAKKTSSSKIKQDLGETVSVELLQCKTCEYQTAREDLLRRHAAKHAPIECPVCGLEFSKGYSFAVHLSEHNPPQSPNKCFYCGHVSKRICNLWIHLSSHLEALKKQDCPKCEFSSFRQDRLKAHLAAHDSSDDGVKQSDPLKVASRESGPYKIFKDRTDAKTTESFRLSSISSHVSATESIAGPSKSVAAVTRRHPSDPVRSKKSKLSNKSESLRECTEKKSADGWFRYSGKSPGLDSVRHKSVSRSGRIQCNNCSYETKIKSLMRRHAKLHLPEGQFVCPKCDFKEENTLSFAKHLRSHISQGHSWQCCFCSFRVKNDSIFLQHLNVHRPVSTYFCSKCDYSTAQRAPLFVHTARHHVRKFVCPVCPKVATKFRLAQHFRKCHPSLDFEKYLPHRVNPQQRQTKSSSGSFAPNLESSTQKELPRRVSAGDPELELLECKTCDYQTAREDLLLRHEAKHAPIECPVCGVELNSGYAFAEHLCKHNTQTSRHKCFYCTYVGKSVPDLYVHLSLHLDALKQHDCSDCEFSSLLRSSLERHLATHSKKSSAGNQKLIESNAGISPERKLEGDPVRPSVEVNLEYSAIPPCKTEPEAGPSRSVNTSGGGAQSLARPDVVIPKLSLRSSESSSKVRTSKLPEITGTSGHTRAYSVPKPKLQCYSCSYETKLKSLMRHHVKLHLPEGQFVCPKCDEFRTCKSRAFVKHIVSHDPCAALYNCCFCSFSTSGLGSFDGHIKTHRPVRELFCSECEFSCFQSHALDTHYKTQHVNKYVCPKCPKVATRLRLSQHVKKCHPSFDLKLRGKLCAPQSQLTQKAVDKGFSSNLKKRIAARKAFRCRIKHGDGERFKGELFRCKTCEFQTARKKLLLLHEAEHIPSKSHGNIECKSPDISSKRLNRCSVYSDSDFAAAWGLRCPDCGFRTMREDLFERHVTKHKPLICPACNSCITDHSQFCAHLAKHNPPSAPFKCHYCEHLSKNRTHLLYHLAVHVNALKKFDCPLCEFSSNRPDVLGTHFGVHRSPKSQTLTSSLQCSNDSPVPANSGASPHSAPDSLVVPVASRTATPHDGVPDSGTTSPTQPPPAGHTSPNASTPEIPASAEKTLTWSDFTKLFHRSQ